MTIVSGVEIGEAAQIEYEQWHAQALADLRKEALGFFLVTRENREAELISDGQEQVNVSLVTSSHARSAFEMLVFLEAVQECLDAERRRLEKLARELGEID